jgi:AraC family transcriptional regulator
VPSTTRTSWAPRAYLWEGGWIGIGRSQGIVPPHAHHAIQISLALDGEMRLRSPDTDWVGYGGAIVQADAPHSFDGNGALAAMLFVDPESHEGRWLRTSLRDPISAIPPQRLDACLERIRGVWADPPGATAIAETLTLAVRGLCPGPPPLRRLDERIAAALEIVRRSEAARVSLESVAKAVFLSPSRFAHLFTEEVGVPFRRYVLWRRLSHAMILVGRGNTLSAAAHQSGFSDSAHFTRTVLQMYGIPPSVMIGRAEFYEIPAPFEVPSGEMSTGSDPARAPR